MKMTIAGVHRYTVRVPTVRIYNEAGEELDGRAIESRRLILISPAVPPGQREEVLRHEVEHVWTWHVPAAHTEEERCQLAATVGQSIRMDLAAQGGIAALVAIEPTPISMPFNSPPERVRAAPPFGRPSWDCGCCSAPMLCGSINHADVVYHEGVMQHQMLRWFECEACGTLNTWTEVATSDGQPTGLLVQVPSPKMYNGQAARDWLADNAMAVGR